MPVKEPPHFPIDLKEKATLIEKEARDGMDVFGDVNKIMDFYCPLLMKCSSQLDISNTTWLGWGKFKSNVCSLGPTAWSQCRMELAAEAGLHVVEVLVFLDEVSERLYETCLRDTSLVNRLQDLNRRNTPKRIIRNDKATIERLNNTMEMNACLSLMHLFYLLYKKTQWNGLDIVTHFFEKMIGDLDALERHCCVLDVEALTLRKVDFDLDMKPERLNYLFQRTEPQTRAKEQEEGEDAWWQWVDKAIRDLPSEEVNCGKTVISEVERIMNRIDGQGSKTLKVMEALNSWEKILLSVEGHK